MKTYNFIVFLKDEEVAIIDVDAETEYDAWRIIEKQYPTSEGYSHPLINN